jgi:hypothetical protein
MSSRHRLVSVAALFSAIVAAVLVPATVLRSQPRGMPSNDLADALPPSQVEPAGKMHPALLARLAEGKGDVKTWVFFTDKGVRNPVDLRAALDEVAASYNQRAANRRGIRGLNGQRGGEIFDEHDLPVVRAYTDAVQAAGARLHVVSNWLNAISVQASVEQCERIARLPFVAGLQPVARQVRSPMPETQDEPFEPPAGGGGDDPRSINYGNSQSQLAQINLIALHDAGYTGAGVVIGMLDSGFNRTHVAFNEPGHPLVVLAEWDFVMNDGNTSQQSGDYPGQANHGTMTLSCIGAYKPGQLVGGAYDASFVLAKTEDTSQEVPAEEDDYVAGIEFLESHGADMATSSLGYIDWYTQAQLNGLTAVTTVAVNIATNNGLHFCTAAGNEYHDSNPAVSHLIAPADAFKVITCGAVDSSGGIAYFSSDGPTADGRVKPEVLARGVSAAVVSTSSTTSYTTADGTSFSTPITACAIACLIQARPYWTVDQMRQHVFETADYYVANGTYDPLYIRGYGIVNAFAAYNSGPNPPEAQAVNSSTAVSVPTTINLVANDDGQPDPPGAMTYIVSTLPAHGSLADPAAGPIATVPYTLANGGSQANYQPVLGYRGPDGFQYKANDGGIPPQGGDSDPATVSITVGGPAWDPLANNMTVPLPMNTPSNIALSASDPNGDPLTYTLQSLPPPSKGLMFDPGAGQILAAPYTLVGGGNVVRFIPPFGLSIVTSFTFTVHDATADSNVGTVSVNVGEGIPQQVYSFPLDADPGWSRQGQWAFGHPTGGGSHNRDPINGHTGANVFGYNLAGDYPHGMLTTRYLTTTALDCSLVTGAQLRFRRWLGVEAAQFDHATIDVSTNGTTWTTVWSNPVNSAVNDSSWTLRSYDLSTIADGHTTVYIRWGMGPTDSSTSYPGWNIDDVEIWGVLHQSCSGVSLGDASLDGVVNGSDVQPFIQVLLDPYASSVTYAQYCATDINHDGFITTADLPGFVDLLLNP